MAQKKFVHIRFLKALIGNLSQGVSVDPSLCLPNGELTRAFVSTNSSVCFIHAK
jgi:hypothetical protein